MWWVLLVLVTQLPLYSSIVTHAVLSQRQAREVAHRWRPIPLVTDGSVTFRSKVSMQRYVRTMILLEEQAGSIGILQYTPHTGLALYVVHPDVESTTSAGQARVHMVRGVVSADAYSHDDGLEALATWHTDVFSDVLLCVHRDFHDM